MLDAFELGLKKLMTAHDKEAKSNPSANIENLLGEMTELRNEEIHSEALERIRLYNEKTTNPNIKGLMK